MADKDDDKNKDQENEEFNEEFKDDSDDSFGLPDVEFNPISEEDSDKDEDTDSDQDARKEPLGKSEDELTGEESSEEKPAEEGEINYEDDDSFEKNAPQELEYEDSYEDPKPEKPENESSGSVRGPLIIIIVTIVIITAAVLGYWFYLKPIQEINNKYDAAISKADEAFNNKQWDAALGFYREADGIKPEEDYPDAQIAKVMAEKAAAEAKAAKEEAERKAREAAAKAAEEAKKPAIGTIETINSATGKYYVIVASNIDDDLAMDYAKRLSKQGVSVKILSPLGNKKFHRVSIATHDTFAEAQDHANELKGQYNAVWAARH